MIKSKKIISILVLIVLSGCTPLIKYQALSYMKKKYKNDFIITKINGEEWVRNSINKCEIWVTPIIDGEPIGNMEIIYYKKEKKFDDSNFDGELIFDKYRIRKLANASINNEASKIFLNDYVSNIDLIQRVDYIQNEKKYTGGKIWFSLALRGSFEDDVVQSKILKFLRKIKELEMNHNTSFLITIKTYSDDKFNKIKKEPFVANNYDKYYTKLQIFSSAIYNVKDTSDLKKYIVNY